MLYVSFAWTTGAVKRRLKSVTRRQWSDRYARLFKKGRLFHGYDKLPRNGGKKFALCRVTRDAYQERVGDITEEHFIREGGTLYWRDRQEFIDLFGDPDLIVWVLEFEILEISADNKKLDPQPSLFD